MSAAAGGHGAVRAAEERLGIPSGPVPRGPEFWQHIGGEKVERVLRIVVLLS